MYIYVSAFHLNKKEFILSFVDIRFFDYPLSYLDNFKIVTTLIRRT